LVIIDPNVEQWEILAAGVNPNTEIHILDPDRDGITQITEILSGFGDQTPTPPTPYTLHSTPLTALHIISHGAPGTLYLGSSTLELGNIQQYRHQLEKWEIAHLYIYGCKVAAGDAGVEFIEKLQQITGTHVSASNTLTGNHDLGGDWELQVSTDEASVSMPFTREVMAAYPGVLLEPEYEWGQKLGGSSSDIGQSIAVDSSGNVYTTGRFGGTVDFDPGTGTSNLTATGTADIFISKLDSSGNFVWAKSMGTNDLSTGDTGLGIEVDSSGNIYTTGKFYNTVDFDPGPDTANLTATAGDADVFISKLNPDGTFAWAKQLGDFGYDGGLDIAVDNSGNIYTTGYFLSNFNLDPGVGSTVASAGSRDIFISKLNADGTFAWGHTLGGSGSDVSSSIAVDSSGNVYITGSFSDTVDFDPGTSTFNLTAAGAEDIFISKLNADGTFAWAKNLGGSGTDIGQSIALDSSGNVYTTGRFGGTVDFDPGTGTSNLTATGTGDIFISKLDSTGNFVWAKSMGTNDLSDGDTGLGIEVDSSGNIYTTGIFYNTVDFDPGPDTANLTATAGDADVFISKLNPDGTFAWAKQLGDSNYDTGQDIAVDNSGNIYTTGYFFDKFNLDPGTGTATVTSAGSRDIFINKLQPGVAPTVTLTSTAGATVNAAFTVTATFSEEVTGFELADITVGNGTASNFTAVSATEYTFNVTPTADGSVTVDVAAEMATDNAGNDNTAATQLTRTADVTGPSLSSVSIASDNANSSNFANAGDTVTLTFTASETLSGTPTVTIAGQTATVTNTSGNNYTATYTLTDSDSEGSLAFNIDLTGVTDAAGNSGNTVTTTTDSSSVTVDITPPTIDSVTSSLADGSYGVGTVVPITINFSEAVNVTGTPELALNFGGKAIYASGSGTNSLTFNYTVEEGQKTEDLDYASANALSLAGGTIRDGANNAILTLSDPGTANSLGAAKDIAITGKPELNALDLGFNKLQESLSNSLGELPVVGDSFKAVIPDFFNTIQNSLISSLQEAETWDQINLEQTIKTALGQDFPDLTVTASVGANGEAQAVVNLSKEYDSSVALNGDLGLPALGFNTQGDANAKFKYDLSLGLGINQDGLFFDTDNTKLALSAEAGLADNFTGKASMGFLQLDLANNTAKPTKVTGDFELSLKDLTSDLGGINDGQLTFNELSQGTYDLADLVGVNFDATGNLGLKAKTSFNGSAAIPSFHFDLNADFPVLNYENGEWSGPQIPTLAFNNMQLDLGSFVTDFAKPVISKINDVVEPIQPVIKALNSDLKPLSQFGVVRDFFDQNRDGKVTLLEAGATAAGYKIDTRFLDALGYVIEATDLINDIAAQDGNIMIDLGDYELDFDPTDSNADLKNAQKTQVKTAASSTEQAKSNSKTKALFSLFDKMEGLSFPVLTPSGAIDLLLGKEDVSLFAYQLPALDFKFEIDKQFPIYSIPVVNVGVNGSFGGSFEAKSNLGFGFDTYGLYKWKESGFSDASKIFDSFYVSDRQNADGTGPDVPELKLKGSLSVGGSVNAAVARAILTGGVEANANVDLLDVGEDWSKGTSGDGKIRGSEITSRISNPLDLFEINGDVKAALDFKAQYGFSVNLLFKTIQHWNTAFETRLGEIKIADFRLGNSSTRRSRAIDPYISGGLAFFDADLDGVLSENEPFAFTNPDGSFELNIELETFDTNQNGTIDFTEGKIVLSNGVDVSTYLPLETPLTSIPESEVVTPLTTMISALVDTGLDPASAEAQVKAALGLPVEVNLSTYDPLEAIANDDPNGVAVFAAMIQVQNTIVQTAKLIEGASNFDLMQLGNAAITAIANTLKSGNPVDFANIETIQKIVQDTVLAAELLPSGEEDSNLNKEQLANVASAAAQVIAGGNQIVQELGSSDISLKDIATEITKLQAVSAGQVAAEISELAASTLTAEAFLANNTIEAIKQKMTEVSVEDPTVRPTFPSFYEIDPEDLLQPVGPAPSSNSIDFSGFELALPDDETEGDSEELGVDNQSDNQSNGTGDRLGSLSSLFFDREYYLEQNPDVAEAVENGVFAHALEHFGQYGLTEGRSPSEFFGETYLTENPDVAEAVANGLFSNGLQHFVQFGFNEGRFPSDILENMEMCYLSEKPDAAEAVANGTYANGLEHFLMVGFAEGADLLSQFDALAKTFNPEYYLTANTDVADAVANGVFENALEHFVGYGMYEGRDPSKGFSNSDYMAENPDVAAAVNGGAFHSAYEHYMMYGMAEGRMDDADHSETDELTGMNKNATAFFGADLLMGEPGVDTFVLGDETEAYYLNDSEMEGNTEYAAIANFDASEDIIQLNGAAADYQLAASPESLPAGTAIYRLEGEQNDLIGLVENVSELDLNAGYFSFV
jgi:hypothetical protein